MNENLPQDAKIAVVDAGALAFYSNRSTIDILGLNNEHIAHSIGKNDLDYVMDYDPEVIQLHVGFAGNGQIFTPTNSYQNRTILEYPEFVDCYRPDLERPDDPFYPYLFLRVCDY
jgi:hypothetical protein